MYFRPKKVKLFETLILAECLNVQLLWITFFCLENQYENYVKACLDRLNATKNFIIKSAKNWNSNSYPNIIVVTCCVNLTVFLHSKKFPQNFKTSIKHQLFFSAQQLSTTQLSMQTTVTHRQLANNWPTQQSFDTETFSLVHNASNTQKVLGISSIHL